MKEVIEYLEEYIGKKKVIEKIRSELDIFFVISVPKLQKWEQDIGAQELRVHLERYTLRYLLDIL